MADQDRNQPRQPRNLSGLLRFCAETTASEDTTTTSNYEEMDQQKREFLAAALKELSVNPVDHMKECLGLILRAGDNEEDQEVVGELLESLTESCEQIDLAKDFYKIGGYQIFQHLLHHENSELRWRSLELIATLVQNNPDCQKTVLEAGYLPTLLELLDTDPNNTVKVKALYAVSCLLRDMPEAQKQFETCDGFSKLMRAMQCDVEKLKVKASFLLTSLCYEQPTIKDVLCDIGMVVQLIGQLNEPHNACHEHLMSALLALVSNHERAQQEVQQQQLQLQTLLQNRIEYLTGKEEYEEEKGYAEKILKTCFGGENDIDKTSEACR